MLLQAMSLLLLLYFGCTTDHRSIPYGYLLHVLVQGHQGPILYFLEFFSFHHWCRRTRWQWTRSFQSLSIWRNRRQGVRRCCNGCMYRHYWKPFWTYSWNLPPSLTKLCPGKKAKLSVLSSTKLSWFPQYTCQIKGILLYTCVFRTEDTIHYRS